MKEENQGKKWQLGFPNGVTEVLKDVEERRGVIVSHGAAIKYFLMNFCTLDDNYNLIYDGKMVCPKKLEYPYIIKILYNQNNLVDITLINTEKNGKK